MSKPDAGSKPGNTRKARMSLGSALQILCDVHTGDDARVGFVIHAGACPPAWGRWGENDYIEAWKIVRAAAGRPTDPEDYS